MKALFSFQGTVSRSRFWLELLAVSLAMFLISLPFEFVPNPMMGNLYFLVYLVLLCGLSWIFFALHAQRLRDAGLSPWLCLLLFVPLVNLVVFLIIGFKPTAVERTGAPTQ